MLAAKTLLFSIAFFAGIFALFSIVFYFGEWGRLAMVAGFGVFIGIVAAPEFDRKAFKYPTILQAAAGACAGYIMAKLFGLSSDSVVACVGLGVLIGASASVWVKHVQVP